MKRVMLLVLAVLMLCSLMPVAAFAAEGSYLGSGYCGDNVTWTLDSNGTLTISGTGAMANYTSSAYQPWKSHSNSARIKSIVVEEGVTTIGNSAFAYITSAASVTIADTVTSIGNYAFQGAEGLTAVTIPASVTALKMHVFQGATGLKEVHFLGNAPTFANDSIFHLVAADVYYPGNDSTWTQNVMQQYGGTLNWVCAPAEKVASGTCGENLTWTLDSNGTLTISGTGAMYNYDEDAPWMGYCDRITALVVNEGVTSIGNYAFYNCSKLENASIADSVASFGARAFYGCSSLKEIQIPEKETAIGAYTFAYSGLTSVVIPDSVGKIYNSAFTDCRNLREVVIGKNMSEFGETVFAFCNSLNSVRFTGSAPHSGVNNVFAFSPATLYYPQGNETWTEEKRNCITYDGNWVPYDLCGNNHIYSDGSCTICGKIGGQCGENLYWEYNDSTLTISGTGAMYDYNNSSDAVRPPWNAYRDEMTTVVVKERVTTIGYCAFNDCKVLSDVSLPSTLTKIAGHGFSYCPSLEQIQLPDGLLSIGAYGFANCGLKSIHLGSAVADIDHLNPFKDNKSLTEITVAENNPNYCAVDNVLFTKDMSELRCYPGGLTGASYTVPEGVTIISHSSFSYSRYLQEVMLPETVTVLEGYAFLSCAKLSQLALPSGLRKIDVLALQNTALQNIVIPASVESIGQLSIVLMNNLESVVFEGDVPQIHASAFGNDSTHQEATVYYPADNATWTEDKLQNYGGNLTWVPYCVGEHIFENGLCKNCNQQYLAITKQPADTQMELGQKFRITVGANDDGLTYQWYVKEAGAKTFKKSANKTSAYAYTMQSYMHNRQVYCVITDRYGNQVTSDVVTITRPPMDLTIKTQPSDVFASVGEKFRIKPVVQGDGLTYQWYYKNKGGKAFAVSGNTSAAYSYSMQSYMDGRQVYCVITDKYGNQVTTDVATLILNK